VTGDVLVSLRGVKVHYGGRRWPRPSAPVRALDGVDLDIARGEVVGLVGESGSGKTTLGKLALRLAPITAGRVVFDGQDVTHLRGAALRRLRPRMQIIFQDPHASLSPRLRVAELLEEPYRIFPAFGGRRHSVAEMLEMVELSPAIGAKYPHELSGGQARRIGIARALELAPDFLVADEPTAGLDVSAAAKILNLLRRLQGELGLTYLVVTHNMSVVDYLADRVAVLYLGRVAEVGHTAGVLDTPAHPYTRALLSSVTIADPRIARAARRRPPSGEIPSPRTPPSGCRFRTRCPHVREPDCREAPELVEVAPGQLASCHFWREVRTEAAAAEPRSGVADG
jgi:oligopeptide/dipeptide ABC transporter ATP-binding protein